MDFILGIIFFIIIGIFAVVITAPFWLAIFSICYKVDEKKGKYTQFQQDAHKNIISILFAGILFIVAITPTAEYMSCDESRVCYLDTQYIVPFLNKSEKITINKNSYLGIIKKDIYRSRSHGSRQLARIEYYYALYNSSRKKPQLFRNYSSLIGLEELENDVRTFSDYKKNPKNEFYITSSLNRGKLHTRLFLWSLLMVFLMFYNLKEDRSAYFRQLRRTNESISNR